MRRAIDGLTLEQLQARVRGPGAWSALEIVMHVADSELVGAVRVRMAHAEPGGLAPGYEQEVWARELAYAAGRERCVVDALDQFDAVRRTTSRLFHRMEAADWAKQLSHPEYGAISLRNLLELYADHGERHLDQLAVIRERLSVPLNETRLLPVRLY